MTVKGKLIVIEGLEGAGKSTALKTVVDFLHQRKIQTLTTREPGGTQVGEQLRSILVNPQYKDLLDPRCELLIFYAARVQLFEEVIKPALAAGIYVIADRFELSTIAYQGGGRGIDIARIQELSNFCLQGIKPDLTLFLDIDPVKGIQRAKLRGEVDRIEGESLDFFKRVHEAYLAELPKTPNLIKINANESLPVVTKELQQALQLHLG